MSRSQLQGRKSIFRSVTILSPSRTRPLTRQGKTQGLQVGKPHHKRRFSGFANLFGSVLFFCSVWYPSTQCVFNCLCTPLHPSSSSFSPYCFLHTFFPSSISSLFYLPILSFLPPLLFLRAFLLLAFLRLPIHPSLCCHSPLSSVASFPRSLFSFELISCRAWPLALMDK